MMPKEPGTINGGMLKRDETGQNPVLVIDVNSEEHLKKIEKAGGKIVMPPMKVRGF